MYTCPQGNELTTNRNWYKKDRRGSCVMVQHYKTKACKSCKAINECTKNTRGRGRVIERTEHASYIEQNRKNYEKHQKLYKRRQAIVEHPYGTIKRQWGFSYIITKQGKARASADVGFMIIAINLRRLINIMGKEGIKAYLKVLSVHILAFIRHLSTISGVKMHHKKISGISHQFLFYFQKTAYI